jgi:hypothetical protein
LVGIRRWIVADGFSDEWHRLELRDRFLDAEHLEFISLVIGDDRGERFLRESGGCGTANLFEFHDFADGCIAVISRRVDSRYDHWTAGRMPRRELERFRERFLARCFADERKWFG